MIEFKRRVETVTKGGNTMRKAIVLSTMSLTLLGSAALAHQPAPAPAPPPPPPANISFFVAENPNQTGNLGGLTGADQLCQTQAQALGAPHAARTWRAYLSTQQRGQTASHVADLHGDQQRDRNNMQKANVLDAKGEVIPGVGVPQGTQNEHDILTGSD